MATPAKKQSFLGGAAILTAAVVIVKLIGAAYKIPLSNILGSAGQTYFDTAYQIYNFLLTFSTAGLPLAISRMTSQAHAQGLENEKRKIFSTAIWLFFGLGLVCSVLMFFRADALARKDHAEADRIISSAFRLIAILALPAGIGLSVLSTPIEILMLPLQPEDALAAGPHLQILGIALIFICLMILTNAILQTYGKEKLPIFTVIAGGVVKVVMNYILVGNPDISIHGAPISTLCCYLTICLLNLFFVWKYSPQKPKYIQLFAKPVVASALMGAAAWAVYGLVSKVLSGHSAYGANALATFCGILAGVVIYGVLVIALRILRAEDVKSLPKGEKIAKLLRLK